MKFIITPQEIERSLRLDYILAHKLGVSRNQIAQAIAQGLVLCNDKVCFKNGMLLKLGDHIELKQQANPQSYKPKPFEDEIEVLYEDEEILVLNKPPHLVVHQAPSVREVSLVDYLRSKGYQLSNLSGAERYGIIHRLDKPTSGAIAIAKSNFAHLELSRQLQNRTMGRYYLAVIDLPLKQELEVECLMGRNPKNRLKMAKLKEGRYSKTLFFPLASSSLGLIAAKLYTGRTHQIRLHLETLSRHIIGDEVYGKQDSYQMRLMLHAYLLYFVHPRTQKTHLICAPLFKDMLGFAQKNFGVELIDEIVDQEHILRCFGDFI